MSNPTAAALYILMGLSAFFLGCLILQCYIYFSKYPRDPMWIKCLVFLIFVLELTLHITLTKLSYTISIVHAGDPLVFFHLPSSWPVSLFFGIFTLPIVEIFYCWRIYKLTKVLWRSLSGVALSCLRAGGWIYYLSQVIHGGPVGIEFDTKLRWLVMLLLLLAVFLNVSIVLAVSMHLSKCRPKTCRVETKKLIDGIILWTISTCMIGLIPHIVSLVMFVTMKSTLVWMCIVPITTKVFANCLLSTLNNRLTNLDDHLGPASIQMGPMLDRSNALWSTTTNTVRGADRVPVINPDSSLPTAGSS